jgi:hypothetical protein
MKRFSFTLALAAILFQGGCFEMDEEVTLNPDGSGKMTVEVVFQDISLNMGGVDEQDPREKLQSTISQLVEQSKGIDAWTDVSYRVQDDGRIYFKGTGYFKDINTVDLHNLGVVEFDYAKNDQGQWILKLGGQNEDEANDASKPKTLTDQELQKQITKTKMEYQQSMAMMRPMLENLSQSVAVHLPAKVQSGSGTYETRADGAITFALEGKTLLAEIDRLMTDDQRLAEQIKAGSNPMKDAPIQPVALTLAPTSKPQFSYAKELAAAQKSYKQLQKDLGIIPTFTAHAGVPSGPVKLTNLRVGGVRLISEANQEQGIRPFNYDQGYTLSMIADLQGPVTLIEEGFLTNAVSNTGVNLMPEREWDRKINFPTITENKRHIVFDVTLAVPGDADTGLGEVSGYLDCLVANKSEKVDLGFDKIAAGGEGQQHGAHIKKLKREKNYMNEMVHALEFQVKLSREMIKAVSFQTPDGKTVEAEAGMTMYGNNNTTYEFTRKQPFPKNTRVVLDVYLDAQKQRLPFQIANVNLLGQSLTKTTELATSRSKQKK